MIPLLEARRISVLAGEKKICSELNVKVERGERWGILGINGAGKTSLLLALCGILPISSGEIRLKGKPLQDMKRREIALVLGLLFQDSEDHFPSSVLETALIGRHPHIDPWKSESDLDEKIALESIRAVALSGMEKRMANTLSGGERRRLALAALLAQDPELYLLDEPTNHLDIRHQFSMLELMAEKTKSGKSLIMILHDPNLAERYCDHALLLFEDGAILSGKKEAVLNEANLSRLYRYPMVSIKGPKGRLFIPDQTAPESGL